jgi:hypothetical protein
MARQPDQARGKSSTFRPASTAADAVSGILVVAERQRPGAGADRGDGTTARSGAPAPPSLDSAGRAPGEIGLGTFLAAGYAVVATDYRIGTGRIVLVARRPA